MSNSIDIELLSRRWIHSHEEDTGDLCVYRPAAYAFPPSRGREELDLQSAGLVRGETAGPTDRRVSRSGTWSLVQHQLSVELPTSQRTWHIVEATDDRLVLRRQR